MSGPLKRTAHLPLGYVAEFRWSGSRFDVLWEPDLPRISSERHRRKFVKAYTAARDEFMTEVATLIGGAVATLTPEGVSVVQPQTRH